MIDLSDRRVLITGGSRGIGAACARSFAHAGALVMVHYRSNEAAAARVLGELQEISDRPHLEARADLSEPDEAGPLFERIRAEWGGLDCLVNNAGIWVHNPIDLLDDDRLEETWRVNLRAPFLCAREAVPLLRAADDGNIVNISSTAGQRGEAFYSPYAASKGAIIAATKSWSTELAPEVRVNAVAPGWVDTDMCIEPFADGGRERIEAGIPLGRVADVEDIAGPVLFLASPLARHITGEILNVNGGSVLAG
jgi:3-oxoacyl-[acyl-carrier protein] reductase